MISDYPILLFSLNNSSNRDIHIPIILSIEKSSDLSNALLPISLRIFLSFIKIS